MSKYDEFAMFVSEKLFNHRKEKKRTIIIIWNQLLEVKHRSAFYIRLKAKRKELENSIKLQTAYTQKELDDHFSNFVLETKTAGTMEVSKRGRGNKGKVETVESFCVVSFKDNFGTF